MCAARVTRTERTAALIEAQAAALGVDAREVEKRIADGNSIRHFVDATEIADVVAFLASPRSLAINGEAIAVGGGVPRSIYY